MSEKTKDGEKYVILQVGQSNCEIKFPKGCGWRRPHYPSAETSTPNTDRAQIAALGECDDD